MGYDYFKVIYATAFALMLSMIWVYFTVDDPMLKKMVMGQGLLSLGLILSVLFYRSRTQQAQPVEESESEQKASKKRK